MSFSQMLNSISVKEILGVGIVSGFTIEFVMF